MILNSDENIKKSKLKMFIAIILILCLISFIIFLEINSDEARNKDTSAIDFNNGWTVQYNDEIYENTNISSFAFKTKIKKGDQIVLTNKLPSNIGKNSPSICFSTHNAVVDIYVENRNVYTYGHELFAKNKMVGSGQHYVRLNDDDGGKSIKIVLTASATGAFESLNGAYLIDYGIAIGKTLNGNKMVFISGCYLILLGIFLILIVALGYIMSVDLFRVLWLSLLAISLGTWTICYHNVVQLFNVAINVSTIAEYFSMMLGTLSVLFFTGEYVKAIKNRILMSMYKCLKIAYVIFIVTISILNFSGKVLFPTSLPFLHVFMFVIVLYLGIVVLVFMKTTKMADKLLAVGFLIFIASISADVIGYIIYQKTGYDRLLSLGISTIGAILFIAFIIVSMSVNYMNNVRLSYQQKMLYEMAYTDELTGLYNRRYCEEEFDRLSESTENYMIISYDLNNLKKINDSLGHNCGDDLISGFAGILKKTFGDNIVAGRMGGDEFIVFLNENEADRKEEYVRKYNSIVDEYNAEEKRFQYMASYGSARRYEFENADKSIDSHAVYVCADNRMYEYKRRSKIKRV